VRIAILEDDPAQLELLQCWIKEAGHSSEGFPTGNAFRNAVRRETFDLIILDWNLPDTTGPLMLAWVRENQDWKIPVLFTTSRDAEEDIVRALEGGADDYMVKPLKRAETMARLGALLRRALPDTNDDQTLRYAPFEFDIRNHRVSVDDQAVALTHKEFQLALFMFRNSGRLLSRRYILEHVWGIGPDLTTRTVDTHVSRLRNKLGIRPDRGWRLNAVYHHGYRLENADGAAGC
jgi:DNA-binding response OmpR family regulator